MLGLQSCGKDRDDGMCVCFVSKREEKDDNNCNYLSGRVGGSIMSQEAG